MYAENFDLNTIASPVDADMLNNMLSNARYDPVKTKFLIQGFKEGFSLGYEGDRKIRRKSPNLKFTIGDHIDLWNKVIKEVKLN